MVTRNNTNTYITPTTANEVTRPLQPIFSAYNGTLRSNITGDGTLYSIIFEQESFDIGSNYNATTGIFTAPVTGKYLFTSSIYLQSLSSSHTKGEIIYNYSGGAVTVEKANYAILKDGGNLYYPNTMSPIFQMTATNTINIQIKISNGLKAVGIPSTSVTRFTGYLIS